jgi:hypothetical protein
MGSVGYTRRTLLWVRVAAAIVLLLALCNLGRVVVAASYAQHLPDLSMSVNWFYLAAMGGFWGLVFTTLGVALLLARPWTRWPVLFSVTLYVAHGWINRLFLQMSDYARLIWWRRLFLDGLLLLAVWGLLNWKRTRSVV